MIIACCVITFVSIVLSFCIGFVCFKLINRINSLETTLNKGESFDREMLHEWIKMDKSEIKEFKADLESTKRKLDAISKGFIHPIYLADDKEIFDNIDDSIASNFKILRFYDDFYLEYQVNYEKGTELRQIAFRDLINWFGNGMNVKKADPIHGFMAKYSKVMPDIDASLFDTKPKSVEDMIYDSMNRTWDCLYIDNQTKI